MKINFEQLEKDAKSGLIERMFEEERRQVEQILDAKGIAHHREEKEGWGTIIVFELKGKKVHCNNFKRDKKSLEVYYYSSEYSCHPCRIKF